MRLVKQKNQFLSRDFSRFLEISRDYFAYTHQLYIKLQTASDLEEHAVENSLETLRSAVEKECLTYVNDHFPNGVCTVHCNEQDITIAIVDNKYNPNNFWNGRWLASWTYDTQSNELKGFTKVNVHYYEDGNVQLNAEKKFECQVTKNEVKNRRRRTYYKLDIDLFHLG